MLEVLAETGREMQASEIATACGEYALRRAYHTALTRELLGSGYVERRRDHELVLWRITEAGRQALVTGRTHASTHPLPDWADDAATRYTAGESSYRISKAVGASPELVLKVLRRKGVRIRPRTEQYRRGSRPQGPSEGVASTP